MISILADTSFLISMADPNRAHHSVAMQYYRQSLRDGALFLSTLVAAEFEVKQRITDLPLRHFVVLPFNIDHAITAGELSVKLGRRDTKDRRDVVKEDVKLIAQAVTESITHVITEDHSTLAKYLARLRASRATDIQSIVLKDGFDLSHFNGGQFGLSGLSDPEDDVHAF